MLRNGLAIDSAATTSATAGQVASGGWSTVEDPDSDVIDVHAYKCITTLTLVME